ncbi:MAG: hypothetical protein SFX72_12445 [Isosphaeraceae bacterium]|nr:hypothetical protein [Isosphaeraceae bacterium]
MSRLDATSRLRLIRTARITVGFSLLVFALLVVPPIVSLGLRRIEVQFSHRWLPGLRLAVVILGATIMEQLLRLSPTRVAIWRIDPKFWESVKRLGDRYAVRGLTLGVAGLSIWLLFSWLPHYWVWPWWTDTDYFAVSAYAWSRGVLPYRDLQDFNFPGPIYVHYVIGSIFGWDRTQPFNMFDSALLIGLGALLVWWSRRRFGASFAGWVAFLTILGYYLGLDYRQVAQRDWHAPLLCVAGILWLEAAPGRASLVGSALLFAFALTIRPHPIVLAPAMLSAIDQAARRKGEPWIATARAAAIWGGVAALGLAAGAAPLILSGIADDFVYWFRRASAGGPYGNAAERSFVREVAVQLLRVKTTAAILAGSVAMVAAGAESRIYRTWTIALVGSLFYRPLSPVLHDYLQHPSILIWSILASLLVSALARSRVLGSWGRSIIVFGLLELCYPSHPMFARWEESVKFAPHSIRGVRPPQPPPGARVAIPNFSESEGYRWNEIGWVIDYLRARTSPETRVGNFMRRFPFPAIHGEIGRLQLFPSPGGILWLREAARDQEDVFIEAMLEHRDAVIVWSPDFPRGKRDLRLEAMEAVIRREFEPEARLGRLEIWRRRRSRDG